ncbi:MAG: thioredoxin domain-containing protein [Bdellovibrionales bacterium]|nr:thioredoxin domain-containing protein [Bdellovibrionales bacterium]
MKKIFILGALVAVAFAGCDSKPSNTIAFKSPYTFVFDGSLPKDVSAKVEGEDISSSQLYSPSPALQELEERVNKIVLIRVYEKGVQLANGETGEDVMITYGFAEPKESLDKILGKKVISKIKVSFDENQKEAAKLNGKTFTRDDIAQEELLMGRLMVASFEQKLQALEGIVTRRKILQASKEANMPMEEYIQKNILKGGNAVTEKDVLDFASKNNITEKELTEELKAQLKDTIQARQRDQMTAEYVAKNIVKGPISVGFEKPSLKIELPKVGDAAPHKGTGPIEIALFSYPQCEDCKDITRTLSDLADTYPKYYRVSYVFNFADNNNEERMVAEASMCLGKQDEKYFWSFPNSLKKLENTSLEENINETVKSLGANFDAFRTCFLAREFKDQVEMHLQSTKSLGFYKTPVVVMDGMVMETPNSDQFMEKALELKAEKGLGFNLIYKLKKFFKG